MTSGKQSMYQLLRAKSSLDRLFARELSGNDLLTYTPFEYSNGDCFIVAEECTPYACTFTVPTDNKDFYDVQKTTTFSKGKIQVVEDLTIKPFLVQIQILREIFFTWLKKLRSTLKRLAPRNCAIVDYLLVYEQTKSGMVHAHGLIYINNNYYTAVSQHMGLIWSKLIKGKIAAMHKLNVAGKYDNAFDKCSDIYAWTLYMLKCNPNVAPFIRMIEESKIRKQNEYNDKIDATMEALRKLEN